MLQNLKNSIKRLLAKNSSKKEKYQEILHEIQKKKSKLSKDDKEYKAYEKIENKVNKSLRNI